MSCGGLRVVSLESRRAGAMEQMIRHHGGEPLVAPSVKEIPFEQHDEVYGWAELLFAGGFDLVVLMTGAGLALLREIIVERYPVGQLAAALRAVTILSRGPKPAAVLREMKITPRIVVPEPNTWREIVPLIAAHGGRRVTIQEYGWPNPDFLAALDGLGVDVSAISVYRWGLPDDTGPLREAVRRIADGECEVILFTTSIQLTHLLDLAAAMGRAAAVKRALAERIVIASVGPVMNAALADYGLVPDIVPPQPRMPVLVRSAAEAAHSILRQKMTQLSADRPPNTMAGPATTRRQGGH